MKTKYRFMLLFFIMLVAILLRPIKAQADPDPRYWHWINSTDEFGVFVSTKLPTKYYSGVKQWFMIVNADKSYKIYLFGFRWNNGKEFKSIQIISYDSNEKVKNIDDYPYGWMIVIPGTYIEAVFDYVASQAYPALSQY